MLKKSLLFVILDGFGIGPKQQTNPIHIANPKTINYIKSNFPAGSLQASGISVGLPWNEEGNSEVGHLTIGAGRIIYQHYPRITLGIKDGSFFKNPVLKAAAEHVKKNGSALNIAGLLTSGNVHASLEHLDALLKFAEIEKISRVNLHLFSDGKDSPPKSILNLITKVPLENVGSVSGRFYAMDRDGHWDRTERAYKAITGQGEPVSDLLRALNKYFDEESYGEELIEPMIVGARENCLKNNDALVFFNFREDSMRQIVSAFIKKDFKEFATVNFKNLFIASMTQYSDQFDIPVISPSEEIKNPLGKILSDNGKIQLRIAETEKYAHVTYFLNGYQEAAFQNEFRILVHSKNVLSHAEHPEMMSKEITAKVKEALEEGAFDIIIVNYANADMIAHTGNFEAGLKAILALDEALEELLKITIEKGCTMLITSDHGNVEQMIDPLLGIPESKHNESPVPIYLVNSAYQREKSEEEIARSEKNTIGILADVAPTILELMNIPKPENITGQSLLSYLI